jgi:uncharacterized protein (DUF433 family)
MKWQDYIISDKEILVGKPVIKGTRLSVAFILERLASGWSEADLLESYPRLDSMSIRAVYGYLADCMKDGLLFMPLEKAA